MCQCIYGVRVKVNHLAEDGIVEYAKPVQQFERVPHALLIPVASDHARSMNDAIPDDDDLSQRLDLASQTTRDLTVKMVERMRGLAFTFRLDGKKGWMEERKTVVEIAQYEKTLARFINDVFPWLAKRPIVEIDGRGARFTAHRVRSEISRVFRYGIKEGVCKTDPAKDLIGAIPAPVEKHFAAITAPVKVGEMLRAFDGFSGTFPVLCALKLALLLFVRPGELRQAEWSQFDLDKRESRYLISKTKTEHLVPLATQAVAILSELRALTGQGRYVFPGARSNRRPMSEAAINAALRRLGYDTRTEITGPGFRAMARTSLHEELEHKPQVIEHQLAHAVPDNLGSAYNRTRFIRERCAS